MHAACAHGARHHLPLCHGGRGGALPLHVVRGGSPWHRWQRGQGGPCPGLVGCRAGHGGAWLPWSTLQRSRSGGSLANVGAGAWQQTQGSIGKWGGAGEWHRHFNRAALGLPLSKTLSAQLLYVACDTMGDVRQGRLQKSAQQEGSLPSEIALSCIYIRSGLLLMGVCAGTGLAPARCLTAEAASAVWSPEAASGLQQTGGLQQRWQAARERLRVLGALAPEVLQRQAALARQRPAHAQPGRPHGPEHGREPAVQPHGRVSSWSHAAVKPCKLLATRLACL